MSKNDMKNAEMSGQSIPLYGIAIFSGTKKSLLELVAQRLSVSRGKDEKLLKIMTPNPEQFVISWKNRQFFDALSSSDVCIPDGAGVVWALKRLFPLTQQSSSLSRISGREFFHEVLHLCAQNSHRVFLLGGKEGSSRRIWEMYGESSTKNPICGYYLGSRDIAHETRQERDETLSHIQDARPDVVFVAFGAPWQELWISKNSQALADMGVKIACVVGGAFEYEAGNVPRVHPRVEKLHLEWLQRLLFEPWRARRQLLGVQFFWRVLTTNY